MDRELLRRVRSLKERPISDNELHWIDLIRLLSRDTDPRPTLALTQAIRRIFEALEDAPEATALSSRFVRIQGEDTA